MQSKVHFVLDEVDQLLIHVTKDSKLFFLDNFEWPLEIRTSIQIKPMIEAILLFRPERNRAQCLLGTTQRVYEARR